MYLKLLQLELVGQLVCPLVVMEVVAAQHQLVHFAQQVEVMAVLVTVCKQFQLG